MYGLVTFPKACIWHRFSTHLAPDPWRSLNNYSGWENAQYQLPPVALLRQLIAMGFLTIDVDGYGTLQLAPSCRAVLRGEQTLQFRKDPAAAKKKISRQKLASVWNNAVDQALWDDLKQCRLDLAHQQKVPPYVIFHDSTLEAIVRQKPTTLQEMGQISGVGEVKLQRYGMAFLEVLEEHSVYQWHDP